MLRRSFEAITRILKKLFESPPPLPELKIEHPRFGTMTFLYPDCMWVGSCSTEENLYEIFIEGDTTGPDTEPLAFAEENMEKLPEIERRIRKFLFDYVERAKVGFPDLDCSDFTVTSFHFDQHSIKNKSIWICLELERDIDGLWRMDYRDGEIRDFGRDS